MFLMNPLVSVIIPIYNGEHHLQECLDSIAGQTYSPLEIICIDDGSTDATPDILAAFAERHDKVVIVQQNNQGAGHARNNGLTHAQGDYLFFFDSDDYCDTQLLEHSVTVAEQTQADFVWMPFYLHDEIIGRPLLFDGDFPIKHYPRSPFSWHDNPDWLFQCVHNYPWNKLVRASFVEKHCLRFAPLHLTEDMAFAAPAAVFAQRIAWIKDAFVYHRQGHSNNLMSQKDAHPLDFYQAFVNLKSFLLDNGVYDSLKISYLNWALGGCKYNLETLHNYNNFCKVYELLASPDAFDQLGFTDIDEHTIQAPAIREFFSQLTTDSPQQYLLRRFGFEQRTAELAAYRLLAHKQDYEQEVASLRAAHDLACKGRDEAYCSLDVTNRKLASMQTELDSTRVELSSVRTELTNIQQQFDAHMNAAEQRIGQAICAVPRAIQRQLIAARSRRKNKT